MKPAVKVSKPKNKLTVPLSVHAREYAEAAADKIYFRAWPIDAHALERALAAAFEAGWRARGE